MLQVVTVCGYAILKSPNEKYMPTRYVKEQTGEIKKNLKYKKNKNKNNATKPARKLSTFLQSSLSKVIHRSKSVECKRKKSILSLTTF